MNGNDGSARPEICVADQCIQLTPGFDQPFVDLGEPLNLLGRIGPGRAQPLLLRSGPLARLGKLGKVARVPRRTTLHKRTISP